MDRIGQAYSVLAVSAAEKFSASLHTLLPEGQYGPVRAVRDAASARRLLLEQSFDIVIVNTPLPDEFGTQLALELSETSGAGVLLLVKAEQYTELSARLTPNGILTLQKPTTPQLLMQTLQLLCGTRERLRRMEQKTASFEEKMAEIRLVNRAKCLLIERKAMTEQEAHRWIEKQAMDRCVSRKIIAEQILQTI